MTLTNPPWQARPDQSDALDLTTDREQLDGLVETVFSQVPGITHEDAEDAVRDAWITVATRPTSCAPVRLAAT